MSHSASRSGGGGSSPVQWAGKAIHLATMLAWPLLVVVGARVAGPQRVAVAILVLLMPGVVVALLGGVQSRRALWSATGAACLAAAAAVVDDDRSYLLGRSSSASLCWLRLAARYEECPSSRGLHDSRRIR